MKKQDKTPVEVIIFLLDYKDGDHDLYAAPDIYTLKKWYQENGKYGFDGSQNWEWKELTPAEIDSRTVSLAHFQQEAPSDGWPDNMPLRQFVAECTLYDGKMPELVCSTDDPN